MSPSKSPPLPQDVLVLLGLNQQSSLAKTNWDDFHRLLNSDALKTLHSSKFQNPYKCIWLAVSDKTTLQSITHLILQVQNKVSINNDIEVFYDAREGAPFELENEPIFSQTFESTTPSKIETFIEFAPIQFDMVVCFDMLKNNRLLEHFNTVCSLLKPKAKLMLFNAWVNDHSTQPEIHAPPLSNIISLAPRLGLINDACVHLPDLLSDGQTTFEALSNLEDAFFLSAYTHWQSLSTHSLENKSQAQGSSQTETFSCLKDLSFENHYLIKLSFVGHTAMHLRYLNESDQLYFDSLFELSFEHAPTPGLWDYKFNATRGHSLGLFQSSDHSPDAPLVAHYGGIKRDILFEGNPHVALQIGDVMVNSSVINSLARKGPFFQIASTFLEEHIGYGKEALLGFGFPNQKAMKVASLLGLYCEVDQIKELAYTATELHPSFWLSCRELKVQDSVQFSSILNRLWQAMRKDLKGAILGVRDANYFFRRYFHRPGKTYRLLLLTNRFTRQAKGLMVFNVDHSRFELIDLLCPLSNIDLLIQCARFEASKHLSKTLLFRITQTYSKLFMSQGAQVRDLDIRVPANTWTRGPYIEQLKNRWWLTSGDMDFV